MPFTQTSHCSWTHGDMYIIKDFCPAKGGIHFKLFDGRSVSYHKTLDEAKSAALAGVMS